MLYFNTEERNCGEMTEFMDNTHIDKAVYCFAVTEKKQQCSENEERKICTYPWNFT